jgi:hypothetical protein
MTARRFRFTHRRDNLSSPFRATGSRALIKERDDLRQQVVDLTTSLEATKAEQ